MDLDALALVILFSGTLFAFTVSSTLGLGGGVLMLPPMLAVFETGTAIAMIAPLMLVNGVGKARVFRDELDLNTALLLGALGWPAALIAGLFLDDVDGRVIKGLIALLIAGMLALEHGAGQELRMSRRWLPLWGGVTGVLSGLTGVSGPTLALALKASGVQGGAFVAVVAVVVVGLQALRIPAYVAGGLLPPTTLPLLVALGAVAIGSVRLGRVLQQRLSIRRWRVLLDLLLGGVGLFLVADVLGFVPR